jgi:diadenosine tetraphosphate (Ap4A) HIT family hydrolase
MNKVAKIRDIKKYTKIVESLTSCPFCVLKDRYILIEDNDMVLTMNLFPYIDYHLMIIPRRHVEHLRGLNNREFIAIRNLHYVASKILAKKGIKNHHMIYREGSNADKSVGHMHIHIVPYRDNVIAKNLLPLKYDAKETAKKLQKYNEYANAKLKKIREANISGNTI